MPAADKALRYDDVVARRVPSKCCTVFANDVHIVQQLAFDCFQHQDVLVPQAALAGRLVAYTLNSRRSRIALDIGVAEHGVAFNDIVAIILLVLRRHQTASNPILSELIVLIPSIILLAHSIGPSLSVHLPIFFLVHMDGPVLALRWCFNPIGILLWPS